MKMYLFILCVLFVGLFGPNGKALGYEEIDVQNGGTITGKITLEGPIPPPRVFPLVLYPFGPFCKKISDGEGNVRLKEFTVGTGGELKDAIVAVQRVEKGKPFVPIRTVLVSVDCMFHPAEVPEGEQYAVHSDGKLHHQHPLVTVFENHRTMSVINRDPIIHNAQVFQKEKGNIILNTPLPVSTTSRGGVLHFEKNKRIAQVICGMHEFMQSWGFVVDNPYYAKTKVDGEFLIDALPPGTYAVKAWHPHMKIIEKVITVPANGTVTLDFEFDSRQVQRPIYETQKAFRTGPATPHTHMLDEDDPRILME